MENIIKQKLDRNVGDSSFCCLNEIEKKEKEEQRGDLNANDCHLQFPRAV